MDLDRAQLMRLYRTMRLIRRFEETVSGLFAEGHIPGFLHLYIGQEAVAAGICTQLDREDTITSTHRGHGHCIAKGADVRRMMAELFGKSTGCCRGKGGSMHVADVSLGILGANGIVGAGIPIAVGAALTAKIRGTGKIAVAFFGEGAAGTGYFHEGLNLAAVLKLPVVFVCESNQYAEFTPRSRHLPVETVASRASAYGFPGMTADGNDVLAVYYAFREAAARARGGEGPVLLECFTRRWSGHYEGDPQRYRPAGEVEEWRKDDPVASFAVRLRERHGIAAEEIEAVDSDVEREIAEAVRFAKESPLPDPSELLEHVYV